jgi:hypothetical protein
MPGAETRHLAPLDFLSCNDVVQRGVLQRCVRDPRSLHTEEATHHALAFTARRRLGKCRRNPRFRTGGPVTRRKLRGAQSDLFRVSKRLRCPRPRPAPTTTAHARPGRRPPAAMATVCTPRSGRPAPRRRCGSGCAGARRVHLLEPERWPRPRVDQVLIGLSPRSWEPARHARPASSRGRRARRSLPARLHSGCVGGDAQFTRHLQDLRASSTSRSSRITDSSFSWGMSVAVVPGSSTDRGRGGQAGGSARRTRRRRPGRPG